MGRKEGWDMTEETLKPCSKNVMMIESLDCCREQSRKLWLTEITHLGESVVVVQRDCLARGSRVSS